MTGRDPGLQPERTRLAWRRTALTVTVVALLLGRLSIHDEVSAGGLLAVALTALVWLCLLALAQPRIRAMNHTRPATVAYPVPLATAVTVAAFAVLGAVLVWWP